MLIFNDAKFGEGIKICTINTTFPLTIINAVSTLKSRSYQMIKAFSLKYSRICFTYLGKTMSGFDFERISRGVIRAAAA